MLRETGDLVTIFVIKIDAIWGPTMALVRKLIEKDYFKGLEWRNFSALL